MYLVAVVTILYSLALQTPVGAQPSTLPDSCIL